MHHYNYYYEHSCLSGINIIDAIVGTVAALCLIGGFMVVFVLLCVLIRCIRKYQLFQLHDDTGQPGQNGVRMENIQQRGAMC